MLENAHTHVAEESWPKLERRSRTLKMEEMIAMDKEALPKAVMIMNALVWLVFREGLASDLKIIL